MRNASPETPSRPLPGGAGTARILWLALGLGACLCAPPGQATAVLVRLAEDPAVSARQSTPSILTTLPSRLVHHSRPLYRDSHRASLGWHVLQSDFPAELETALAGRPGVTGVHRARRLALDQAVPSTDPLRDQQWALDRINAEVAWTFTEGSTETVIALIDSGVEPGHPDLVSQWAVNTGEDLDGDGVLVPDGEGGWRLDPDDLDGLDTDGNGFVDDLLGWDFTDAPAFPATGDYLDPDNQPWDEHGHGTAMAGILSAARHNGLGISGMAPGCRVLPLRAANSAGWLEEDDVAAAILYAVDNGARLLNLSFGDPSSSPLLEDVLRWAADRGVITVASSGNQGDGQARYPAAYPSVIAVGAAREVGDPPRIERSPSSSYGPGLALLAPGADILTTAQGGEWQEVSGTSAAAPCVTGALALLISHEPGHNLSSVRARLAASAWDLESPGWDERTGAGLLDAGALLALPDAPRLEIHAPATGSVIHDWPFGYGQIVVSAWGAGFRRATLRLGPVREEARLLASSLGVWYRDSLFVSTDPPLPVDSVYTLWLELETLDGALCWVQSRFRIDDSPALLEHSSLEPVMDGEDRPLRLVLGFNEPVTVRATVAGRETASPWRSREHALVLQAPEGTQQDILLESTNEAGLVGHHGTLRGVWPLREAPAPREEQVSTLPAGYWLGQAGDWDLDGHPETVIAPWLADRELPGAARAFRLAGGDWQALDHSWGPLLPRGCGDTDGDGHGELLLGAGGRSELWESTDGGLPDRLAWFSDEHWAANLLEIPALGPDPLLLLAENTSARRYSLWRCAPDPAGNRDPQPERLFELPSPWENEPRLQGPPQGILANTDGVDGPELWLTDRSGHLHAYTFEGGRATQGDTLTFPGSEGPGAWLVAVPGEPRDRLALLLHDPSPDTESAAAARVWRLLLLGRSGGNGPLVEQDSRLFLGVQDGPGFHNGLALWNPDGQAPELALLLAPRAYSIGLDSLGLGAVSQLGEGLSGATPLALDGDGDGAEELWLPRGGAGAAGSLRYSAPEETWPLPPLWRPESGPLDETRIRLAWRFPYTPPEEVVIRLVGEPEPDRLLAVDPDTPLQEWVDSSLVDGQSRQYRLASRSGGLTGPFSPARSFRTGAVPTLLSWQASDSRTLDLEFDRGLLASSLDGLRAIRAADSLQVEITSRLLTESGRRLHLGLPPGLEPGGYELELRGLRAFNGSPLEDLVLEWHQVPAEPAAPALLRAEVLPGYRFRVQLSEVPGTDLRDEQGHFRQDLFRSEPPLPGLQITGFVDQTIDFGADACGALERNGPPFLLIAEGLVDRLGRPFEGANARIEVQAPGSWIPELRVFPNPWRADEGGAEGSGCVRFSGLTDGATVRIYDLSGRLQQRLENRPWSAGDLDWDLSDRQGRPVPSGVYFYKVESRGGSLRQGRLAVIR